MGITTSPGIYPRLFPLSPNLRLGLSVRSFAFPQFYKHGKIANFLRVISPNTIQVLNM